MTKEKNPTMKVNKDPKGSQAQEDIGGEPKGPKPLQNKEMTIDLKGSSKGGTSSKGKDPKGSLPQEGEGKDPKGALTQGDKRKDPAGSQPHRETKGIPRDLRWILGKLPTRIQLR